MTKEEKQILLKDLCARLPYGVKVHIITHEWFYDKIEPYDRRLDCDVIKGIRENRYTVKPYLRPMSSMTDAEKKTLNSILDYEYYGEDSWMCEASDWLNEYHFDNRGLIEKGLALEAPEDMYKTE